MVSILVPVYNSEKYLSFCLSSLASQDYGPLEILVLDDGSSDHSLSISEEFSRRDGRIRVIREKHGGIGRARNILLREARGEYVLFVDSDDALFSPDFVSCLMADMDEYGADVVASRTLSFRSRPRTGKKVERKIYSGKDYAFLMTRPLGVFCYSHSRLIKKTLFDGESFPENMIFEDVVTMPWVIKKAEKVVLDSSTVYCYRINREGLSHSPFSRKSLDEMEAYWMNEERGKRENDRRILKASAVFFLTKYYYYYLKVLLRRMGIKKYSAQFREKACQSWRNLFL